VHARLRLACISDGAGEVAGAHPLVAGASFAHRCEAIAVGVGHGS